MTPDEARAALPIGKRFRVTFDNSRECDWTGDICESVPLRAGDIPHYTISLKNIHREAEGEGGWRWNVMARHLSMDGRKIQYYDDSNSSLTGGFRMTIEPMELKGANT